MILYCKDSLGCIDNNNIELINNYYYKSRDFESIKLTLNNSG